MAHSTEIRATEPGRLFVPALFTLTIFTSALLLFFVQPLFTRLVLPQIGGAASVWTTAMLFFQTVLIGGYVYAHVLARHLGVRAQITVHLSMLALAVFFLPLAVPESWTYDPTRPVVTQTLWLYALGVGLPFAVLSANAPLIQSWYRRSGGPHANDPYFLYGASNLGSLMALLAFPLVAEPLFGMTAISWGWSAGFVLLGALLLLSGLAARGPAVGESARTGVQTAAPSLATMAIWAIVAFVPSSLMLGLTSKISMDIGSFPLVWVLPLSLYLLTFVLVFSSRSPFTATRLRLALPVALAILFYYILKPTGTLFSFALLLASFCIIGLLAHRILFETRPDAGHLTLFYIVMSVGGALGGIFNSIVAPLVFNRLDEITITTALAATLLIRHRSDIQPRVLSIGLIMMPLVVLPLTSPFSDLTGTSYAVNAGLSAFILFCCVMLLRTRPAAGTALVALMLGSLAFVSNGAALFEDRSFFGPHIVTLTEGKHVYSNGTTVHGAQFVGDFGGRPQSLTYYHKSGPMAGILTSDRGKAAKTIGVVGLGVGSLACYAQPGQDWHFYEIDTKVVEIAQDPKLFTFMSECGKDAEIHLGDARIVLQRQTELRYDILIIDAYSSDAVPVHLATREALKLYRDRLNPGGLLVFHISNRYYDLSRPLAASAAAIGLESRINNHKPTPAESADGAGISVVVALSVGVANLGPIATDPDWIALPATDQEPWTDDHADILSALN